MNLEIGFENGLKNLHFESKVLPFFEMALELVLGA